MGLSRNSDREVPSGHAHAVAGLVLAVGDARAGRRAPARAARETAAGAAQLARGRSRGPVPAEVLHQL